MKVQIRRLADDVALPAYQSAGAAAFDLASNEAVVIGPREVRLVGTGLVVVVPEGHGLVIAARSSLAMKKGLMLANGIGLVDPDYSGPTDEVRLALFNFGERPVEVTRGERLAQGLVVATPRVHWEEAAIWPSVSRGGFGATGGYE